MFNQQNIPNNMEASNSFHQQPTINLCTIPNKKICQLAKRLNKIHSQKQLQASLSPQKRVLKLISQNDHHHRNGSNQYSQQQSKKYLNTTTPSRKPTHFSIPQISVQDSQERTSINSNNNNQYAKKNSSIFQMEQQHQNNIQICEDQYQNTTSSQSRRKQQQYSSTEIIRGQKMVNRKKTKKTNEFDQNKLRQAQILYNINNNNGSSEQQQSSISQGGYNLTSQQLDTNLYNDYLPEIKSFSSERQSINSRKQVDVEVLPNEADNILDLNFVSDSNCKREREISFDSSENLNESQKEDEDQQQQIKQYLKKIYGADHQRKSIFKRFFNKVQSNKYQQQ